MDGGGGWMQKVFMMGSWGELMVWKSRRGEWMGDELEL